VRTSTANTSKQDYIHLNDCLNEDAGMAVLEEARLDGKPATRSTQVLAATKIDEERRRGSKGVFVTQASYLESQGLILRIQDEKRLRQDAEAETNQLGKEVVWLERQVQHSRKQMHKSTEKGQNLVAQAQAKTLVVQEEVKVLKGALQVKIPSPTSHIAWVFYWVYTGLN
jgi:hypothetical protein